ncbi:hypothetical protein GCM10022258_22170 [Aquimarina gracilis]
MALLSSLVVTLSCKEKKEAEAKTTSETQLSIDRFNIPGVGQVETVFIEDESGIVLIDAQRTKSAGKQVIEMIKSKDKELYAVIITHPHPDHVGGLPTILEAYPNTPVLGTKATKEEMRTDSEGEFYFARKVNGDEYPTELSLPTQLIKDGETITFGDIKLVVDELGPGEAIDMNVFYSEDLNALFVGDLMDNNRLGFVLEKRTTPWLKQLDEVLENYKDRAPMAYPGHGDPEKLEVLVEEQKKWLNDLRNLVAEKMTIDSELTDAQVDEIEIAFQKLHPNQIPVAPIPDMMKLNIKAVAEELALEK